MSNEQGTAWYKVKGSPGNSDPAARLRAGFGPVPTDRLASRARLNPEERIIKFIRGKIESIGARRRPGRAGGCEPVFLPDRADSPGIDGLAVRQDLVVEDQAD